ncbi:MAG: DUF1684 domain-containing protein [Ignavibacteriae bacterium]|nr:DUF1684 domain-containing protein [Ignavibacteriota bacterium]
MSKIISRHSDECRNLTNCEKNGCRNKFGMTSLWFFVAMTFVLLVLIAGCSSQKTKINPEAYQKEILQWQKERDERLRREDSWLTLIGLFWLKEGENKFGSDSANAIILPEGKAPKYAGSIYLEKGNLRLETIQDLGLKIKDSVVINSTIQSDGEGTTNPTIMNLESLILYVIKRGEQFGVRLKDKESSARVNFKGMEYFPINPKWRIEAKFEPYTPAKLIPISTQIGTVVNDSCPGAIVFDLDGQSYRLDAVIEEPGAKELFIMFSDETSGKETYGNGRQLYCDLPDANGNVILDFNKAYNWPCVFTPYATCPIPPRQNHLSMRVEAGEKMYSQHF